MEPDLPGRLRPKLKRPLLPATFIPRTNLLAKWSKMPVRPLTLITAPAGAGKTTAACYLLQSSATPSCWMKVDDEDNRLKTFLFYLIMAIRDQFPAACPTTQLMLQLPELPNFDFIKATLINELAELPDPLFLVLDHFHHIHEPQVVQLVTAIIENQPTALRLFILTRRTPPLPLPRLRARKQMIEIRMADLALDPEEVQAYLDLVMETAVAPETAARLADGTEGWIQGLVLAGSALRDAENDTQLLAELESGRHKPLIDYFSREVLAAHTPIMRRVVQRAAILESFCAALFDALLADQNDLPAGQVLLEQLLDDGGFLLPIPDRPGWFRFHSLLRSVLLQNIKAQLSQAKLADLHHRASLWLAQNDDVDAALVHALAAENRQAAAAIVQEHAQEALIQERMVALDRWLQRLPQDLIWQHPGLLVSQAWLWQLRHCRAPVKKLLTAAEDLLNNEEDGIQAGTAALLRGEIAVLHSGHSYWHNDIKQAHAYAQAAVNALSVAHPAAGYARAYLLLSQKDLGEFDQTFQMLRREIQRRFSEAPATLSPLLAAQAHLALRCATLNRAINAANQLVGYGTSRKLPLTTAWGHYYLGRVHYQRNDLDVAANHFYALINRSDPVPLCAHADSVFGLALIEQARGNPEAFEEAVAALNSLANVFRTQRASLNARLALMRGDIDAALSWTERTAVPGALAFSHSLEMPLLTRILVLITRDTRDSLAEAIQLLTRALKAAEQTHNRLYAIRVLALRALALQGQGRLETAVDVLNRTLEMGWPEGMLRIFLEPGAPMARLLNQLAQTQQNSAGYASHLLKLFSNRGTQIHPLVTAANETLIEPLTNRELEVLQLLAGRFSNAEIAQALGISPLTVKKHTINIYQKLNVQNRQDAVARAGDLRLVFASRN